MSYIRLYRSTDSKVIGGVCGGLGEYFEVDPSLVRLVAVLLFLATHGFAVIAYIVGLIIIPKRPATGEIVEPAPRPQYSSWTRYLPGLVLIFLGAVLLIRQHWFWFDIDQWWPALLVLVGLYLLLRHRDGIRCRADGSVPDESRVNNNGGTVS